MAIRKTTKGPGANYRPTKSGAGMTAKGVKAYRAANPGSKLKSAICQEQYATVNAPSIPYHRRFEGEVVRSPLVQTHRYNHGYRRQL